MGERLLMSVFNPNLNINIWLYHHWFGYYERFMAMTADLLLSRELYKRRGDVTAWVHAFLDYDENGFHITNAGDDRNYMAFIDVSNMKLLWFDADRAYDAVGHDYGNLIVSIGDLMDSTPHMDYLEDLLNEYGVKYIEYRLDPDTFPTKAIEVVDKYINHLERLAKENGFTKYLEDLINFWKGYKDRLLELQAKYVGSQLD